jgi:hypothetical protein
MLQVKHLIETIKHIAPYMTTLRFKAKIGLDDGAN